MGNTFVRAGLFSALVFAGGCSVSYQAPVSAFRTGVNTTVSSVRPYFVEMNRAEAEFKLYQKLEGDKPWGTEDFNNVIPPDAIAIRINALKVISDYADLLEQVATSTASADLTKSATTFGTNVQSLASDVANAADKSKIPDISSPLASIVTLVGTSAIEKAQNDALGKNIKDAAPQINKLIELLRKDLQTAVNLRKEELAGIRTVQLKLDNLALDKASPSEKTAMVSGMLDANDRLNTLLTIDAASLFDDMESAHDALVKFASMPDSDRTPKRISDLTEYINVFVSHAQLVANAVNSVRAVK